MYDNYKPWFSAKNHCLELGGDLATFHNVLDASAFVKYDEPIPFIGLRSRWWNWNNAGTECRQPNFVNNLYLTDCLFCYQLERLLLKNYSVN